MSDPNCRAAELDRAHRTLCRGARFFASPPGQGVVPPAGAAPISHRHRSKWIGNGLRKLDRFLHHLLDVVAHGHGLGGAPGKRNTAHKLRALRTLLGADDHRDADHVRLLALGGTRACLFHCDGIVRSHAMAAACWTGLGRSGTPPGFAPGMMLVIVPADLEGIGHFYHRLADGLVQRPW